MKLYLLSIQQPDGGPASPEALEPIIADLAVFNEELKQLSGFINGVLIVIVIGLGDDDQKWGMICSVCCTFGDRDRAIKRGHRTNPFIHGEGAK